MSCLSPWFAGLTCDHLYADCPNRTKARATLEWFGWWDVGTGGTALGAAIDPHGSDICGLCVHRHNRRDHKEAVA